jgi:hypothetical protein
MYGAAQSETKAATLGERPVAIGLALAVSAAMIGWLYMLALAVWDGAAWLLS